jgi:acyl-CoA thioester hydrolase
MALVLGSGEATTEMAGNQKIDLTLFPVVAPFVQGVTVQAADIDEFGHTNNVVYLSWLERVAWAHSVSLGLSMDDYRRLGCGCVARKHELEYLAPTFAGEELLLGTWVQENDYKLTMWRAYQVVRPADGKTVLRGRTHWVCVDLKTGKPRRMPPEFVNAYRPAASATANAPATAIATAPDPSGV